MPPKTKDRSKEVALELCLGNNKECMFCGKKEISDLLYGKLYLLNGLVVHYFCLLLSSRSVQNGADDDGIWGFLSKDIKDELTRGSKETCTYCKKPGATIFCCNKKCKKKFHLPCGMENGSLHQYFNEFRSFCQQHRIIQTVDLKYLIKSDPVQCSICTDDVVPTPVPTSIWAPCCKNNSWFHRRCIQELALSAGYFFKCPLCSNHTVFKERMLTLGIYIPSRDASWETTPNAYSELLERPNTCSAAECLCLYQLKRDYHQESGPWEIILCSMCGSNGIHYSCGSLEHDQPWCCSLCSNITGTTLRSKRKLMEITSTVTSSTVNPTIPENSSQSTWHNGKRTKSNNDEYEDVQGCPLGNRTQSSNKRQLEITNTSSSTSISSTSTQPSTLSPEDVIIISSDDEEEEQCESNAQPSKSIVKTTTECKLPVIVNFIPLDDHNLVEHPVQNSFRQRYNSDLDVPESPAFDSIDLTFYD